MDKINAFLFISHKINGEIFDRYYKLQHEVEDFGELFFLLHQEEGEDNAIESIVPENITPYIFNIDSFNDLDYEPIEESIIPGSNHFATLQFFLDNPDYRYYWVIEYDVLYTGNWTDFFLNFNHIDSDFISSHIERFPDNPNWFWWNTLHLDGVILQKYQVIKSFNPIYRISNNALIFLNNLLKGRSNWGHHEVLIPTTLKYWGLSILDFGGNGEFVLPQFEEKFYFSSSMYPRGTMRYRPYISEEELSIKNKLLHPAKTYEEINKSNNYTTYLNIISVYIELQKKNLNINNEILWAHLFQDTIKHSSWLTNQAFSPGRWAVGYPMLYLIYRVLQSIKPLNILELGLGESSKLTVQYVKKYSEAYLRIIEQDQSWLDFFEKEFPDLSSFVIISQVIQVPIEYNLHINLYENLLELIKDKVYDFIIIDGPRGTPWHSRNQIIEIINNNLLAENFVIIMDDYERRGEKQTINELYILLSQREISYVTGVYSGNKDVIVICSENYKYITLL